MLQPKTYACTLRSVWPEFVARNEEQLWAGTLEAEQMTQMLARWKGSECD